MYSAPRTPIKRHSPMRLRVVGSDNSADVGLVSVLEQPVCRLDELGLSLISINKYMLKQSRPLAMSVPLNESDSLKDMGRIGAAVASCQLRCNNVDVIVPQWRKFARFDGGKSGANPIGTRSDGGLWSPQSEGVNPSSALRAPEGTGG